MTAMKLWKRRCPVVDSGHLQRGGVGGQYVSGVMDDHDRVVGGSSVQLAPVRQYSSGGQADQSIKINSGPMGKGCWGPGRGVGYDTVWTAQFEPHTAVQLRPAPADERDTGKLPLALAGTLVDTDDAVLSGTSISLGLATQGPERYRDASLAQRPNQRRFGKPRSRPPGLNVLH